MIAAYICELCWAGKQKIAKTRRKGSKAVKQGKKGDGVGRKGARQCWRRAKRKGSKKGMEKIGKVVKKEGKDKRGAGVRKDGKERMLSYCNVLYICGIIPWSLFIAAGSD